MDGNKNDVATKRGRPLGTVLSERTKDKISSSLLAHFKKKDLLASSMKREYVGVSEEVVGWIEDNKEFINSVKNTVTEKRLSYLNQIEICFGFDINNLGHNTNPEFILLLKESLQKEKNIEGLQKLYSLI